MKKRYQTENIRIDRDGIVRYVAKHTLLNRDNSEEVVKLVIHTLADILTQGGEVTLPGIGIFRLKEVDAQTYKNGVTLDAYTTVKFSLRREFQKKLTAHERYLPFDDNIILECLPETRVDRNLTDEENIERERVRQQAEMKAKADKKNKDE